MLRVFSRILCNTYMALARLVHVDDSGVACVD